METPAIQLTDEQSQAITVITKWLKTKDPDFRLGGYAGTGKTTIVRFLLDILKDELSSRVVAFTGKAVNVLERKKVASQTLHSLMYDCLITKSGMEFRKKCRLDGDPDLVIVDEASMISKTLYDDLTSFGKKVLFVGDPGQLEPIGDNPNLMAQADFVLSTIHRQAEQSPIIKLANNVRRGGCIVRQKVNDSLHVIPPDFTPELLLSVNQIICAKNKTRRSFNDRFRRHYKREPQTLMPNEKIICLRNNQAYGLFNGMILFVDSVKDHATHWTVSAKDEIGQAFENLPLWKTPFVQEFTQEMRVPRWDEKPMIVADYAYAITCHKSQGSEWDSVLVVDEWMPPQCWDMKRWRYTAITRAAKKLVYCI